MTWKKESAHGLYESAGLTIAGMFDSADPLVRNHEGVWDTEMCGVLAVGFKLYRPARGSGHVHEAQHHAEFGVGGLRSEAGLGTLGRLRVQRSEGLDKRGTLSPDGVGVAKAGDVDVCCVCVLRA